MNAEQPPPDPADVPVPLDGVDGDPGRLLQLARDRHRDQVRAQRDVFLAAAMWAEMHSEDSITGSITEADWVPGGDRAKPIAGAGCPLVAEFAIAEFAVVIGRSTDAGRRLIGQAVETRHRLPHLWAQVSTGRLEAWKAGQIADATMPLNANAAAFVDAQVACVAVKVGGAQLGRLIGEAITRFDPARAEAEQKKAADARCFNLGFGHTGGDAFGSLPGSEATVRVDGVLGYADARDLDHAVKQGAADLAALGSTESLDVRRAQALGVMARHDLTLDLTNTDDDTGTHDATGTDTEPTEPTEPTGPTRPTTPPAKTTKSRQVVIYAHLSADAVRGTSTSTTGCDLARVEGHGWVTADQVRSWCGPDTQVTVKPVIDLADCTPVDAYEVPDRLTEQVILRDPSCVFPWCHRPARRADCDHVQPHADSGPTCTCNLAPLCRTHHRLKTHTSWTYDHLGAGTYLWTSPHHHRLRRDPTGTTLLDPRCACQHPSPGTATEP